MKCSRCGNELKPDERFCPSCGAPVSAEPKEPSGRNTAALLKRAFLFLEDGNWAKADEYCERVLDEEPDCAQAYLGKLMAELGVRKKEDLANVAVPFDGRNSYQKILRFGDDALSAELQRYAAQAIVKRQKAKQLCAKTIKIACLVLAVAFVIVALTQWIIPSIKYSNAIALYNAGKYEEAATAFEALGDYRDSKEQIEKCKIGIKEKAYDAAMELYDAGKYEEAAEAFEALGDYRDAAEMRAQALLGKEYQEAEALLESGDTPRAAIAFGKLGDYSDARDRSMKLWAEIAERETISASVFHTVGLKSDGTVVATKYTGDEEDYDGQCDVSGWTDIVAISAGSSHTVGLKSDGTVVAVGENNHSQCNVSDWTDIVAISAGSSHTVGLKADGTVVAVGYNGGGQCDVSGWTDIVAIAAGLFHTVGLKSDGTVVATEYSGVFDYGQCDVSGWTDIVAISAGSSHTVGLKSDGTVVAVGENYYGQCNVSGWTDIKQPK